MKIHTEFEQNSGEWEQTRAGKVTASELDALITPLWKARTGDGVQTYLTKKLAEKWLGGPLPSFQALDMEFGHILEAEARPFYTVTTGREVQTVGFIESEDGKCGCSPDGLISLTHGLEIKSPRIETHIRYLLDGGLPKDYAAQVHGSMFITGATHWDFMSYRRGLPPLIITIERDAEIQDKIQDAVTDFLVQFDAAWAKLVEINGGEPKRVTPPPASARPYYETQQPETNDQGVIP